MFVFSMASAQVHQEIWRNNPDLPFEELVQKIEDHYRGKDKGRGTGYKQFKRWEYYHSTRLNERGYIQNVPARTLEEYLDYRAKSLPPEDNTNFDCTWEQTGGHAYEKVVSGHNGGLGRIHAVVLDPDDANIIYAGTPAGGLWRTTNGGGTWDPSNGNSYWEPLTDGIPSVSVSGIAIDPTSPMSARTIYILTGDGDGSDNPSIGVLKSFDGGETWFQTGLSFDLNAGFGNFTFGYKLLMAPDDPNTLYAATTSGLYRTTDGGITWGPPILNGVVTDIEFRPDDPETIYAVTPTTFWRTTNGGDDWDPITCGVTNTGVRMALAVTPADPNYVYILSGGNLQDGMGMNLAGTFRGVYLSTDGGDCFTQQSTTPNILDSSTDGSDTRQQATYDLAFAASSTDENLIFVGGINTWRSDDGGQNWERITFWNENSAGAGDYNHADVHTLDYIGNTLYSGSDGGVYYSDNDGDDWINISQGLRITQFYRIDVFSDEDVDYVMGGAQDNGLNQIRDEGSGFGPLEHWEGADGFGVVTDVENGYTFGAIQFGTLFRFEYPGGSFDDKSPPQAGNGPFLSPVAIDHAPDPDAIFVGIQDVYRSDDSGDSWTNISNGLIDNNDCRMIGVAPSDGNYVYVVKPNNIYRTTDGGTSWTDITDTLPVGIGSRLTYVTIDPNDPDRIWLTMGGFVRFTTNGYNAGNKVFYSDNGGDSWVNISDNLPNLPANCIVYQSGSNDGLYVGMDVGVYYRDNTMDDWVLYSNGLPNAIIAELEINYSTGKLYAGTFGRGAWCTDLFSSCNPVCLDCPDFTEIHSLSNKYSSESCITSSSQVYDETNIIYSAEDYIHLQENFHVQSFNEGTFHGLIDECDPAPGFLSDNIANLRAISGYYVGELPGSASLSFEQEETTDPSLQEQVRINAYPNPTYNEVTLDLEFLSEGDLQIMVYDILGHAVRWLENGVPVEAGSFRRTYNLAELPGGTYVVELKLNEQRYYQTIIKLAN